MSAALFSLKRFPMVVLPFSVIGFFLIRSRFGTAIAYVGAISSLVLLVAFSDTLAKKLPGWPSEIDRVVDRREATQKNLFRLQTLTTRLEDVSFLKRPENWEPFGVEWFQEYDKGSYGVHSLVVKIFLRFGWVPIMFGGMALLPLVWLLHRRLLRRIRTLQQGLFAYATSLSISMFLAAALGAAFFGAFPAPVLFGMLIGISVGTGILPEVAPQMARRRPTPQAEPLRPPLPGRAAG
jgi:hypothetical protein